MKGMVCGDNRFKLIEKYKNKLIESTNIETTKDEMAVIDSILFRFWQMGWLDKLENFDRQKAEIERLNVELVGMRGACESYKMHYDNAQAEIKMLKADKEALINGQETLQKNLPKVIRAEAIKEFAERLKEAFPSIAGAIDYIKKEMVGDNNGETRRA